MFLPFQLILLIRMDFTFDMSTPGRSTCKELGKGADQ